MRGHIHQKSRGVWAVVYDLPRRADGSRNQKWVTVRGTKRDAEAALSRLPSETDSPPDSPSPPPTAVTVSEYCEQWLSDYAEG